MLNANDYQISMNVAEIKHMFDMAPNITREEVGGAVKKGTLVTMRNVMKESPVDTGRNRSAVNAEVTSSQGKILPGTKYTKYIEFGTKGPRKPPPLRAIQVWAKRHGIPAGALQRSIARKGTKPNPHFARGFAMSKAKIEQLFDTALTRTAARIAKVKL